MSRKTSVIKKAILLSTAVLLLVLSGCELPFPFSLPLPVETDASPTDASPTNNSSDEEFSSDSRLINRIVARGENWVKIVVDSPFQISGFEEGKSELFNPGRNLRGSAAHGQRVGAVYHTASFNNYPYIDGSTVCIPMGAEFARQHLGMDDDKARRLAEFSTTPVAYNRLISRAQGSINIGFDLYEDEYEALWEYQYTVGPGVVDLILVTEPSDDELDLALWEGVELVIEPICWDAFVFITNKDNPVESITVEQIRQIYTGEIVNWSELGGDDQEIVAYQREQNSGSQTTMEKQVMNELPMIPAPMARQVGAMGMLLEAVAEYVNNQFSIGYTFKYYVDNLYYVENIKVLEIDGIAPTDENVRNKSYPFSTNYFAVYRSEDKDRTAGAFVEWIISGEGQRCIGQAGYIPLH